jgi:hypothetical protein
MMRQPGTTAIPFLAMLAMSCTMDGGGGPVTPPRGEPVECGTVCQRVDDPQIQEELTRTRDLTPEDLLARYPARYKSTLGYDPTSAANLDVIQASPLRLSDRELAQLRRSGLALSERQHFPTFMFGYLTLYMAHMPLYISADSILHAVHRSYDKIVLSIERTLMADTLRDLLGGLRDRLAQGAAASLPATAQADVDLHLAVALSLLKDSPQARVAGADPAAIEDLYRRARAADGAGRVTLFGRPREVDFSQFKPRGHYAGDPILERYFRAMMWLGRIELRLLEPEGGKLYLERRQVEATLAVGSLMDEAALGRWRRLDAIIRAFVGEEDNLTVAQLPRLLAELGIKDAGGLRDLPDQAIAEALFRLGRDGIGTQRIASQILKGGIGSTAPLPVSFLLLGQRYVVDSHVFSNVVYDRVIAQGRPRRLMPDPLDVAFAALGNNQAAHLLKDPLATYGYAPQLHATRFLIDGHGTAYWESNLYNLWLSALRTLSPGAAAEEPEAYGLPGLAGTEAWGRRLLSTQLASWAELRHDTLLYAKPSYSGVPVCEFPDAYIDPYPRLYEALSRFAARGYALIEQVAPPGAPRLQAYFLDLRDATAMLAQMAERQRAGQPFTDAQMRFVNQTVHMDLGCASKEWRAGWYAKLHFDPLDSDRYDPPVADVHTQPADESGAPVGRVLHVGTGMPRLLAVALQTCRGPRAYLGLASAYFEQVTSNFERLDDQTWAGQLMKQTPQDPPFVRDLVVR